MAEAPTRGHAGDVDLVGFANATGGPALRLPAGPGTALAREHGQLIVTEGVLVRTVRMGRQPRAELLGAGDVIMPSPKVSGAVGPDADVRWEVLLPSALRRVDATLLGATASRPDVVAALSAQSVQRAQRLAVQLAIGELRSVEERLAAIFMQLADRWGRMTPDGILVPLPLSHELIGRLVGARRPTVTSGLGALARAGRLLRRPDRTWVVGPPPGVIARPSGEP